MKAFFHVDDNFCLVPHDEATQKYMLNRKEGQVISAEIKQARSYPQLERFMKFIDVTFDMQEFYEEKKAYRYWLTMKCGYFDAIATPNGSTIFKAHSISFESMAEDEFRTLFSRAIDVFLRELGNGLTEAQVMAVINFD